MNKVETLKEMYTALCVACGKFDIRSIGDGLTIKFEGDDMYCHDGRKPSEYDELCDRLGYRNLADDNNLCDRVYKALMLSLHNEELSLIDKANHIKCERHRLEKEYAG